MGERCGCWNWLWLLERALEVKQQWERVEPLPLPLAVEVERQLAVLFRQAVFEKADDEWLDWDFEFPEYSDEPVRQYVLGAYVPSTGFPLVQGASESGRGQVAGGYDRGSRNAGGRRPIKYFTVSEVGEMVSDDPSGPNWALLPDGQGGYDVFDIRAFLEENPDLDYESTFETTELGRVIISRELALGANGDRLLGRLLTWKHPKVVAEHDGRDGRDLWYVIGNMVYDITDFPFESEAEKEALIAVASRKTAAGVHCIAWMRITSSRGWGRTNAGSSGKMPATPPSRRRTFTFSELGRHIYPQIGMYCAIDGDVFDLSRYLHSHPGGAQILYAYAGRDATSEFIDAHSDWVQTLRKHADLVVGLMIDEITNISHLENEEVVLLGRVHDFSSLKIDDVSLFHQLTPYTGTDATHLLKTEDPPPALLELLKRDNLVCAKLVSSTRRLITPVEFSRRNHFPSKTERQNSFGARDTNWRVWVAVAEKEGSKKQMVYDVTSMVMFGGVS